MPKHYKEMIDEIINKMDESAQKGFIVKFAKSKGGKYHKRGIEVKRMLKRH